MWGELTPLFLTSLAVMTAWCIGHLYFMYIGLVLHEQFTGFDIFLFKLFVGYYYYMVAKAARLSYFSIVLYL